MGTCRRWSCHGEGHPLRPIPPTPHLPQPHHSRHPCHPQQVTGKYTLSVIGHPKAIDKIVCLRHQFASIVINDEEYRKATQRQRKSYSRRRVACPRVSLMGQFAKRAKTLLCTDVALIATTQQPTTAPTQPPTPLPEAPAAPGADFHFSAPAPTPEPAPFDMRPQQATSAHRIGYSGTCMQAHSMLLGMTASANVSVSVDTHFEHFGVADPRHCPHPPLPRQLPLPLPLHIHSEIQTKQTEMEEHMMSMGLASIEIKLVPMDANPIGANGDQVGTNGSSYPMTSMEIKQEDEDNKEVAKKAEEAPMNYEEVPMQIVAVSSWDSTSQDSSYDAYHQSWGSTTPDLVLSRKLPFVFRLPMDSENTNVGMMPAVTGGRQGARQET